MKLKFDPKANAAYIHLEKVDRVTKTKQVFYCQGVNILVDFKNKKPVGIEILTS